MKIVINFCLSLMLMLFAMQSMFAQCTFNNALNSSITLSGSSVTTVSCVLGGQYVAVPVTAGETYLITTCNSTAGGDSQITLYDGANTAVSVAYNDDDCGLLSTVNYVATFTGTLYIQVNNYNCISGTTCFVLDVSCVSCGGAAAGCTYTLDLFDTFGDGWNSASLDVIVNGVVTNTYTFSTGFSATFSFSVSGCDVVSLSFNTGLFDAEISYNLYENPNLITPIYSADYTLGSVLLGTVFTTTCGGAACGGPSLTNTVCDSMAPICTSTGLSFTVQTSGVDANVAYPGPDYGCLSNTLFPFPASAPDPTFWYFEISTAGPIDMLLSAPADIDFIIWGPFSSLAVAQSSCTSFSSIVDCSYSTTNNETPSIPNALVGEVYVMMITNYAGAQQQVSLTQTGGLGATDCSIVNNCNTDVGTVNVSLSNTGANNYYLCAGDSMSVTSNNDFVLPPSPDVPGLGYALYACPPTTNDPDTDPCWTGYYWTGQDFTETNDINSVYDFLVANPQFGYAAASGNVLYWVPITMDDIATTVSGGLDDNLGHDIDLDSCYDIGVPIQVNYLNPITASQVLSCGPPNVLTVTLSGGYPEFVPAGSYTISNTGPGALTQSGTQGETITITGLNNGAAVSFSVTTDANGCTFDYTFTVSCSGCAADAGTVTTLVNGLPATAPLLLCQGDCFDVFTDSNFVLPPPEPGEESELMFALYTGPPNLALEPDVDPNFSGLFWTGDSFSDCNDPTSTIIGAALPSNFWMVPITMDDSDNGADPNGIINYDQNGDTCYALGTPIEVVYLDSINATIVEGCTETTFILTGGFPSVNISGVYTVGNTGAGTFVQNGAAGDTLVFSGYAPGQSLSFNVSNDGNGCATSFNYQTQELPTVSLDSITNVSCNGGNTGAIDISVQGDTLGCVYTLDMFDSFGDGWDGSNIDVVVNGVNAANYTVVAANNVATINVPNGQSLELIYNYGGGLFEADVTYNLDLNGATIFSDGPSPSLGSVFTTTCIGQPLVYTSAWSNGSANEDISGLVANSYTVTITDPRGCTVSAGPYTVAEPPAITITIDSAVNTACSGATGMLFQTSSGGVGPYSYLWSNGATTEDIAGLSASSYTVTVTDNNGCTASNSGIVSNVSAGTISFSLTHPSCNGGSDGCIQALYTGGTSNVGYMWSNGSMADSLCGLSAGNYTLTVTDTISSGGGSTTSLYTENFDGVHNWTLNVPSGVNGTENNFWVVNSNEAGNPVGQCGNAGGTNQTLHITSFFNPAGGAAYDAGGLCGNPIISICPETNMRAESPSFSTVGQSSIMLEFNYIANGQAGQDFASVWYNVGAGWVQFTTPASSTICGSGQGLWTQYSMMLPAACDNQAAVQIGINWQNNDDATGTDPSVAIDSIHVFTISGGMPAQICTIINDTTLVDPPAIATIIDTLIDASCGLANGAVSTSSTGGTGSYTFNWSNGATTDDISGLSANTYILVVSDANSCTDTLVVPITQTAGPSLSAVVSSNYNGSDVSCNGASDGAVTATASGGTGPYTYSWNTGQTTALISGLGIGNYRVTVTDLNGCTASSFADIIEPFALALSVDSLGAVVCLGSSNGFVNISLSGGTTAYNYLWSNGATAQNATGLMDSIYSVVVTDANGCTVTDTFTVSTVGLIQLVEDSIVNVACNGDSTGAVLITSLGDTSTFACSSPVIALNEILYRPIIRNGQEPYTGEYIELIGPPGANIGCYILSDGDWTITIPAGTTIPSDGFYTIGNDSIWGQGALDLDAENCACFTDGTGGQGLLILTDGGEYVALFDDTGAFVEGLIYGTPSAQNTPNGQTINTVGTASCVSSVTMPAASAFETTSSGFSPGTSLIRSPDGIGTWGQQVGGSLNGCNTFGSSSNSGNVSYLWSNGDTSQNLTNVTAGTYTVTATNSYGCTATDTFTVTEAPALSISAVATAVVCAGDSSGSISTTASANYSYLWNTSDTSANLTNIAAGLYTLTFTDAAGNCQDTLQITVAEPDSAVIVNLQNNTAVSCNGGNDGSVSVLAAGGTANYAYQWLPGGSTTSTASGLSAGLYIVTVTDANNCTTIANYTVSEPTAILIASTATAVGCNTSADGTATAIPSGGNPGYSYLWDASANGQTTAIATGLISSTYSVTVTDSLGCQGVVNGIFVAPSAPLDSSDVPIQTIVGWLDCDLNPIGALSIVTNGAYSYIWSNGATTQDVSGLDAANYSVTISSGSGCTVVQSAAVLAPFVPSIDPFINSFGQTTATETNGTSVNIDGGNDQSNVGVNYLWEADPNVVIGNDLLHSSTALSNTSGNYVLTITATSSDSAACSVSDTLLLLVQGEFQGMPDAFTPNGDGFNDLYLPVGISQNEIIRFRLFNRWGQEIYNGDNLENGGWNGQYLGVNQPTEVYLYLLEYAVGTNSKILKGEFTLIR